MGPRIPPIFTAECRTSQTWQSPYLSFRRPFPIPDETFDLWRLRPPPSFRLLLLPCPHRVASFNQCPCWYNCSVLRYSLVGSIRGPQRITPRRTECPLSDAPDHTASGVRFTHPSFKHRPLSTCASLLDNLSSSQTFRSFQERTCRSSSSPHEGNPEESIGTGSICDALATART